MKILIAEDDKAHQKINEILMEDWEFEFDMVSNGRQAFDLAKANEGEYDLCLMDIDLPGMNGWDATKLIRQELKYLPIVALTANPWFSDKYLEIGMDDYIEKPYDMDQLYKRIKELTVKSEIMYFKDYSVKIRKEMPMDQKHATEIRQLKKRGLARVKFGTNGEELILHENATNKISHDFILKGHHLSVFLNHDPDRPTRCELYKEHCHITQTFLDDMDYDTETVHEKEKMKEYTTRTLKPENDKCKD